MKKDGPGAVECYSRVSKGTIGSTQLLYPNKILTQGEKHNFGGVSVEFILSNDGHSPGDLLMWLPKQKIIFGADVLSSDCMPMITGHRNISNLITTLYAMANLNPNIVLTGHDKATTVKSVTRDFDLLSSVWRQVKTGYENDKKSNETLLEVRAKLGPKVRPLYKNFVSEIERHVNLMCKLQQ
jgi:glyoxylase-like metal-dependent hydrolase (beta-lactamase superfamily II)